MTTHSRRILSLLPSATEIVYSLGLADSLVGVTHECDFPPDALSKPRVTRSVIQSDNLTSREIDEAVRQSLADGATIYHLDRELLEHLAPDLVLTQELCDVCAVGAEEVAHVLSTLSCRPQVVSLEPRNLTDVLDSILVVGEATGVETRAVEVVDLLKDRISAVQGMVAGKPSVPTLTLEWLDPVFVGGHWVPEMVELAGGQEVLGQSGQPSREVSWKAVRMAEPETIVVMPCGFGLQRSIEEFERSVLPPEWYDTPAVQNGKVFIVDGSSYFNRPGPRLVDGLEILGSILHPETCTSVDPGSYVALNHAFSSAH